MRKRLNYKIMLHEVCLTSYREISAIINPPSCTVEDRVINVLNPIKLSIRRSLDYEKS